MSKQWKFLAAAAFATVLTPDFSTTAARADIFRWEYINPANPNLGKQQSTMLTPGGAGVNASPGANLSHRNLAMAYLTAADLSGVTANNTHLTNAELRQANLTNANFSTEYAYYPYIPYSADLTGANLTQANLTNANFSGYVGFDGGGDYYFGGAYLTGANLSQANLTGADFWIAALTNANLSQADLRAASFSAADLTGANLTDADIRGTHFNREWLDVPFGYPVGGITLAQLYSTASYKAHDLTGIGLQFNVLTGANFVGQNLTNADFRYATLTNADLSQANLTGARAERADFGSTGITRDQLYSTASYQAHDLRYIGLAGINLSGVNLAGQNLDNANFSSATLSGADLTGASFTSATLTGANLHQANLTNANFAGFSYPLYDEYGQYYGEGVTPGANLTNANMSAADARGAKFQYATLTGANANNLVQSNGYIAGLNLTAGASLVVRDYDGNPAASPPTGPLPILVDGNLAMSGSGVLKLVFDADAWDSTISFAPGISVTRGGTLELTFAPDVNAATQIGRTIDLFDWSGVGPTGTFNVISPFAWNLSKLYTTGEVTLLAAGTVPGDFDSDGDVDGADFVAWQTNFPLADGAMLAQGDADSDGDVDGADFVVWQTHFPTVPGAATSAVPEPSALFAALLFLSAIGYMASRARAVYC